MISWETEGESWKNENTDLRLIEDRAEIEECITIRSTGALNAGIEEREDARKNPETLWIVMGS